MSPVDLGPTEASVGNTCHHQHIMSLFNTMTFTNRFILLVLRRNYGRLQYLLVKLIFTSFYQ